jgi:hypothetical protein
MFCGRVLDYLGCRSLSLSFIPVPYITCENERNVEKDTIKHILQQNQYQLNNSIKQKLNKESHKSKAPPPKKNKKINMQKTDGLRSHILDMKSENTNIIRNTNLKVAYRTANNIRKHVQQKQQGNNTYEHSGIYRLKCKDCPLEYIGQTGRSFNIRYKEHISAIKHNKDTTAYTKHWTRIWRYARHNGSNTSSWKGQIYK